jgi:hypothetical protein
MRSAYMATLLLATIVVAPATAIAQQIIDIEAVWNKNWPAVVQLKVTGRDANGDPVLRGRTGTGVMVRANGTIITALHVVGHDEEWFELPGGARDRKVEVIGLDSNKVKRPLGEASVRPLPAIDIAILHITAEQLPAAEVAETRARDLASAVAILWNPNENLPHLSTGVLTPTDRGQYGDRLTVQMPVDPGNSGSGIFGGDRTLIGIITNALDGFRALAVPTDAFLPFLPTESSAPIEKSTQEKSVKLDNVASQVGEKIWQWTAFIEADSNVLEQIECVEYILHPTFPNPRVDVCSLGDNSKPFALSAQGWGTFNLKARVLYKDRTYQEIERRLRF